MPTLSLQDEKNSHLKVGFILCPFSDVICQLQRQRKETEETILELSLLHLCAVFSVFFNQILIFCVSVCLPACWSVCSTVCLSVCLSVCLTAYRLQTNQTIQC